MTVTEVWETREQWERWFNASVTYRRRTRTGVTDLHNALG